jgi:hypothetical protein
MPPDGDHQYFASTAVFLNEVIKLAICLTFAIYEASRTLAPQTPASVIFEQIYNSVFSGDGWKLAIPATLYTFQNTLQYVALGNLDPVHFQILYQLKVGLYKQLALLRYLETTSMCADGLTDPHNCIFQRHHVGTAFEPETLAVFSAAYCRSVSGIIAFIKLE